jgi:hypothetical protein
MAGDGLVPGSARLHLIDGLPLLRPDEQVFEAMLRGWRNQQLARNLSPGYVDDQERTVRSITRHADAMPWQWTPQHILKAYSFHMTLSYSRDPFCCFTTGQDLTTFFATSSWPGSSSWTPPARPRTTSRRRPQTAFHQHADSEILLSFPGLGPMLGARVLAELGDDRARFADARALKSYAGSAPITRASGKKRFVGRHFVKNNRLINAGFLWAFAALTASPGANAHYRRCRTTALAEPRLVDHDQHRSVLGPEFREELAELGFGVGQAFVERLLAGRGDGGGVVFAFADVQAEEDVDVAGVDHVQAPPSRFRPALPGH